ncbi:MAG: PTS sugar transporter subunit IIA [Mycoplasmatales bacterium]|nr:PTS sugar transporter subunit IIA [Mycoplasmatales bacterium]
MKIKVLDLTCKTRDEVLETISKDALKNKFSTRSKSLLEAFKAREETGTTGFENGIAIPHARISAIKETVIYIARIKDGVDWPSLDGEKTTVAVALLVPGGQEAGDNHMELLSKIASKLMHKENVDIFKRGTVKEIKKMLDKNEEVGQEENVDKYDFVCISTCPTGVAHTNMAAEAMEKWAKENNKKIKVERQGATGPVNQLTEDDIKKAKYVVVASSRPADGLERFNGKKVLHVPVAAPIKSAQKVFNKAVNEAKIQKESRRDTAKRTISATGGAKPMAALMNGISYMIPFVVVAGILVAISLAAGGNVVKGQGLQIPPHTFWSALSSVGGAGFQLMIPILAGFIASAIAGRSAIAPAMIVAYVVGNGSDTFFNWQEMQFGMDDAKLGFLGSIFVGFFVGYIVKTWQNTISIKMPKALKPVEPILFIPILVTFFSWLVFSFFLYVPIYYIALGINNGLEKLLELDLLFLVALIVGAMIAFDMGGPFNKLAFLFAGGLITSGHPEVMGAAAAAIAIPPMGMGLAVVMAKLFKNKKFDSTDKGNSVSALFMSIVGITEGAIPFAVKYPKQAIAANVIGGSIGAAMASLFLITDNAMHGGPIVYLIGAIGKDGVTNYLWGLLFLLSILVGAIITAVLMNVFMIFDVAKPFRYVYQKSFGKLNFKKSTKNKSK